MPKCSYLIIAIILVHLLFLSASNGVYAQSSAGSGEANLHKEKILFAVVQPFESRTGSKRYDFLETVLPASMITQLSRVEMENISFMEVSSEQAGQKGIDAWITGEYAVDKDVITVSGSIKERAGITFPIEVSAPTDEIPVVTETLFARILEIVKGRITAQGEWRVESILTNEAGFEEYLARSERYYYARDYDPAILMCRRAIYEKPDDVSAHLRIADIYRAQKKYTDAISEYQYLIKRDKSIAAAHSGLGMAYFKTSKYDNAISEFEKALGLSSDDPRVVFESYKGLGDVRFAQEQYKDAVSNYLNAEKINCKKGPEIYLSLGQSYLNIGNPNRAIVFLEEGQELFLEESGLKNDLASTYNKLGESLCGIGHYDEARKAFRKAIELDPEDNKIIAEAYLYDGIIYKRDGHYNMAIECLETSFRIEPTYQLCVEMGETYRRMGKYLNARAWLDMAFLFNLNKEQAHRELRALEADLGEEEQIDNLTASVASLLVPGFGQHLKGRYWRGLFYEGLIAGSIGAGFWVDSLELDSNALYIPVVLGFLGGWVVNMIDASVIDSTEQRLGAVPQIALQSTGSLFIPGLGQHLKRQHLRGFLYEGLAIGTFVAALWARDRYSETLDDYSLASYFGSSDSIDDFIKKEEDAFDRAKSARNLAVGTQIAFAGVWFINVLDATLTNPILQERRIMLETHPTSEGGRVLVRIQF
jgi:tetratricopeptide (TPR) repeat protein